MKSAATIFILASLAISNASASEVMEEPNTRAVVREHPKTGRPYVSIVPSPDAPDPFQNQKTKFPRPDYRMLDPRVKSGTLPYEGPYSDRTKVYVFAAALATLGTVGGAVGLATAPAATGAAASGGAGAYLAGGTAVVAGSAATWSAATRSGPDQEDGIQIAESRAEPIKDQEAV